MKKTYINPSMEVIQIATQQMLAASNPNLGGEYGGGVVRGRGNNRGYDDWDDEEDW